MADVGCGSCGHPWADHRTYSGGSICRRVGCDCVEGAAERADLEDEIDQLRARCANAEGGDAQNTRVRKRLADILGVSEDESYSWMLSMVEDLQSKLNQATDALKSVPLVYRTPLVDIFLAEPLDLPPSEPTP